MVYGNKMHYIYSYPYKSFDRQLCRYRLGMRANDRFGNFRKNLDENIQVRGKYDDLRVLYNPSTQEKFVSLVEVKTTSKDRLWIPEQRAAVFQLQLYIWMLREHLEYLGYILWKHHYVEVYSQKTGNMMMRIQVHEDPQIEDRIRHIVKVFQGLERMTIPPREYCKICPRNIKVNCDWYKTMKGVMP